MGERKISRGRERRKPKQRHGKRQMTGQRTRRGEGPHSRKRAFYTSPSKRSTSKRGMDLGQGHDQQEGDREKCSRSWNRGRSRARRMSKQRRQDSGSQYRGRHKGSRRQQGRIRQEEVKTDLRDPERSGHGLKAEPRNSIPIQQERSAERSA